MLLIERANAGAPMPDASVIPVILVILVPALVKLRHQLERDLDPCDLGQLLEAHH